MVYQPDKDHTCLGGAEVNSLADDPLYRQTLAYAAYLRLTCLGVSKTFDLFKALWGDSIALQSLTAAAEPLGRR